MSAPWSCWLCGGGDGEYEGHRRCDCVTVKREDWRLMRRVWYAARAMEAGDPALLFTPGARAQLDALFFAGEVCRWDVHPVAAPGGEDTCR